MMATQEKEQTFAAREPAWRLFAAEFNDSRHETSDGGERSPTYVVTPLGARVNRVLAVGVLTANDPVGEDGSVRRAQITDPTGVFHVYAGQYQPEALQALTEIEPPAIVAVVGKARTYSPQEGVVYTSIRPEVIHQVSSTERDAWILETARHTLERVEARMAAGELEEVTEEHLRELGVKPRLAKGVAEAVAVYGSVELSSYLSLSADALSYLLPAPPTPRMATPSAPAAPSGPAAPEAATPAPSPADAAPSEPAQPEEAPEVDAEEVVFDLVESLDQGEGAPWDVLVAKGGEAGLSEEEVEEAMNLLMDRGRVFEPVLGRLKAT